MEIDRIDNSKGYAPGNLRFADHRTNCINQRRNILPEWNPSEWPYSRVVVVKLLKAGTSREGILARARLAVQEKRKNWRGILAKLESMTSSTQDRDTDSR
jgi:hypothetical protein